MIDIEEFMDRQKVYVCVHVLDQSKAVLLVNRSNGDWRFFCGCERTGSASTGRIVGITEVLERDRTLLPLADLPSDWEAERAAQDSAWIKTRCGSFDA